MSVIANVPMASGAFEDTATVHRYQRTAKVVAGRRFANTLLLVICHRDDSGARPQLGYLRPWCKSLARFRERPLHETLG